MRWTILSNDNATGWHHEVITCVIEVDTQEEVDHGRVVGWNLAAITK
jgi:hypothetical protein